MADIKTRDVVKGTIKKIDKAAIAADRMRSAYVQTKEKAEHTTHPDEHNAEEYASDRVEGGVDRITHEAAHQFDKQGRKRLEETKRNVSKAKDGVQRFREKRAAESMKRQDYSVKLVELRERLKEYTGFDYSVIPESIVEAFIERIWVSKDEFRWYLRTGNNADSEFDPDDHIKIGAFTLTIDDAKKYIYSFSTRRRVYKWADLNVSVWI